jgi:hypothetical protein
MVPRANWKGFLRLSLVTCPVALFPATSDSEKISFNQINKKSGHRIRYLRVDAESGEEVPSEEKGLSSTSAKIGLRLRPIGKRLGCPCTSAALDHSLHLKFGHDPIACRFEKSNSVLPKFWIEQLMSMRFVEKISQFGVQDRKPRILAKFGVDVAIARARGLIPNRFGGHVRKRIYRFYPTRRVPRSLSPSAKLNGRTPGPLVAEPWLAKQDWCAR